MDKKISKVVSIKLCSSETIIAELVGANVEEGYIDVQHPFKLISGVSQEGEHFMLVRYDPACAKAITAIGGASIITINDVNTRFKKFYLQHLLKYHLLDREPAEKAQMMSDIYDYMYALCAKFGVDPSDDLLPVPKESFGVTVQ